MLRDFESRNLHHDEKNIYGAKAYGLEVLKNQGLRVPNFVALTSAEAQDFQTTFRKLESLNDDTAKKFGDQHNPLLLAVRSSPVISMPGMMDTILNIGISINNLQALSEDLGAQQAYDTYRRFLVSFGTNVIGIPREDFSAISLPLKKLQGVRFSTQLALDEQVFLCDKFRNLITTYLPTSDIDDPYWQLKCALGSVIDSSRNSRTNSYLEHLGLESITTGIIFQEMVLGNSSTGGSGVVFSRNITTGEKGIYGEYLPQSQGDEIVEGVRSPHSLTWLLDSGQADIFNELRATLLELERICKDVVDVEFCVENNTIYYLQLRPAKRTPKAEARFLVDLVKDGVITSGEAIDRMDIETLFAANTSYLDDQDVQRALREGKLIGSGLPASQGCVTAEVVIGRGEELNVTGKIIILNSTYPEDFPLIKTSAGVITEEGGVTSHAALCARQLNKPAIVSAPMRPSYGDAVIGNHRIKPGDILTIDGNTGNIYIGSLKILHEDNPDVIELLQWLSESKVSKINPEQLNRALDLGRLINDFYISQMINYQLKNHRDIPYQSRLFHHHVAKEAASAISLYLLGSVILELSNLDPKSLLNKQIFVENELDYLQQFNGFSGNPQEIIYNLLNTPNSLTMFIDTASYVLKFGMFDSHDHGGRTFGGEAWFRIARTLCDYLSDPSCSPSLFVDRALDLRHNDNVMFDKFPEMIDPTSETLIKNLLSIKKNARNIQDILSMLKLYPHISEELRIILSKLP